MTQKSVKPWQVISGPPVNEPVRIEMVRPNGRTAWIAGVLALAQAQREAPEVCRLRPDAGTRCVALGAVMEDRKARGRQVYNVRAKNLGCDMTSLDLSGGELRPIEVNGIGSPTGAVLAAPNQRCLAEGRRDRYWHHVATNWDADLPAGEAGPKSTTIKDPARPDRQEVTKVPRYALQVQDSRRAGA